MRWIIEKLMCLIEVLAFACVWVAYFLIWGGLIVFCVCGPVILIQGGFTKWWLLTWPIAYLLIRTSPWLWSWTDYWDPIARRSNNHF